MSDESQPPQLRLRPRKREDEPAPSAAPATPPPVAPSPVEAVPVPVAPVADAPSRFRLKPKLNQEPEEANKAGIPAGAAAVVPMVEAMHAAQAGEPMVEIPRLKLKPLTSIAAPEPAVMPPEVPPPVPAPVEPAASVVGPAPDMSVPAVSLPASPLVGGLTPLILKPEAPPPVPVLPSPPVVLHLPNRPVVGPKEKKFPLVALLGILVVLLGGAAYFVFRRPTAPAPVSAKPAQAVSASAPVPVAPPPPQPEAVVIAPLPPPPSELGPVTVTNSVKTGTSVPVMTPAFRAWIANARITGVITGSSPKAIINGRLVRPGDMIDAAEGIALDAINAEQKLLVFRNRSGATATKPY